MTKEQHNAYQKEYYKAHKEQMKAANKAWREAHKEQVKAANKAWCEANREQIKAYQKAYQKAYKKAHKEQRKAANKAWCEANREQIKAYQKEYYKAHKEELKAYKKAYQKADVNSLGQTKNYIRNKSQRYLKKYGTIIPGYEIHHCCTYAEPYKFIYCSIEMHRMIHSYLRQHNIDADSNHYEYIKHLLDDTAFKYNIE